MRDDFMNEKSKRRLPTVILGIITLTSCGGDSGDSTSMSGNATTTQTIVREAIDRSCIPIAADGNLALASNALGLNVDTTMIDFDGAGSQAATVSIRNYINQNATSLGGQGVSTARSASVGYFRAVTALSLYICDAMAAANHVLVQDLDNLAMSVFGAALFVTEVNDLDELRQSIIELGGTPRQQTTAQCAVILSSLEAQCVQ